MAILNGRIATAQTQPAPTASPDEVRGRSAEQDGRYPDAFQSYQAAYKSLPTPATTTDDQRLRESIIRVAARLNPKPQVPQEAEDHLKKANELLNADALLGGTGGVAVQQSVVAELEQAVRVAPWWPAPLAKLAAALQKLGRVDEALVNLNLYRLADPAGYAALGRGVPAGTSAAASAAAPVASGPAVLYLYWLPKSGILTKPKTLCDGQYVADLQNGRYIRLTAAPGNHTVKLRDKSISGNFVAGQSHYIRASIEGAFSPHLELRFTNVEEAAAEMRDKDIIANDPKRTFSLECKPDVKKKK